VNVGLRKKGGEKGASSGTVFARAVGKLEKEVKNRSGALGRVVKKKRGEGPNGRKNLRQYSPWNVVKKKRRVVNHHVGSAHTGMIGPIRSH